jgi:hypothetical protein
MTGVYNALEDKLNKRVDDALTELDTQRNRMSGLARENSELKQELKQDIDTMYNFISLIATLCIGITIVKIIAVLII